MFYISTRNEKIKHSAAEAILMGIAEDGGLYIPEDIATIKFPMQDLAKMSGKEISATVLSLLFSDGSMFDAKKERFLEAVSRAYDGKFENGDFAPVTRVGDAYVMELYHGPTCAFKDVALQLLPHLISEARASVGMTDDIVILTATSGDTGSAALEGFSDIPGIKIVVFYPKRGTSAVQERQMVSCAGKNTFVCAVEGNFDDAQGGVKRIFNSLLPPKGVKLSSANSINIGRLAPQIAYYFKSYRDLVERGEIKDGDKLNFVVPTGNFGDILAGYFAKQMGLPVAKLICASNENNVLTEFFKTGVYDKNRDFHITTSPSMDILVSSNLERLLYFICGSEKCKKYMSDLATEGKYTITADELAQIREIFDAECASGTETAEAIKAVYENHSYLIDTHTAVAWSVYEKWSKRSTNGYKSVILSTASPYKFSSSVLSALGLECKEEFDAIDVLAKKTGINPPKVIRGIRNKKIVHSTVIGKDDMTALVQRVIGKSKVTVRVPATSANLGAGFDCAGIAFNKYDVFEFEKNADSLKFEGFEPDFANEDNLAYMAFKKVCDTVGYDSFVTIRSVKTDIPIARGLGSSAALIVAGAYAANLLTGQRLTKHELFEICNSIEGHPDNIAPALFGGLCTSAVADGAPIAKKYPVSNAVCFTAIVPDFKIDTSAARAVLPSMVAREDAIFNIQRAVMLPYAFSHADFDLIKLATADRLHEKYRKPHFRNIDLIEAAANESGAVALTVSGAGPTCLAFSQTPIASELNEKIAHLENGWSAFRVLVDNEGVKEINDEQVSVG